MPRASLEAAHGSNSACEPSAEECAACEGTRRRPGSVSGFTDLIASRISPAAISDDVTSTMRGSGLPLRSRVPRSCAGGAEAGAEASHGVNWRYCEEPCCSPTARDRGDAVPVESAADDGAARTGGGRGGEAAAALTGELVALAGASVGTTASGRAAGRGLPRGDDGCMPRGDDGCTMAGSEQRRESSGETDWTAAGSTASQIYVFRGAELAKQKSSVKTSVKTTAVSRCSRAGGSHCLVRAPLSGCIFSWGRRDPLVGG